MKWYINNWYRLTIVVFTALSFYMGFWGHASLSYIQIILMYSFMALLTHQFEEYVFPGGGPMVINKATFGEKTDFRCYPGNMRSAMIVNNSAYVVYILAIVFPDLICLGLGTMFFNLFQLISHGIQMNRGIKTWYNPGLVSVVFLFVPISIYYMYFIVHNQLATGLDWLFGGLTFLGVTLLTTILPVQAMKSRNSLYPIPERQLEMSDKVQSFTSLDNSQKLTS